MSNKYSKANFDNIINRNHTQAIKLELRENLFGKKDVIPLWVADMDFETPEFIRNAVIDRAKHEIYGYTLKSEDYYFAIQNWLKKRYTWNISTESIFFSPGVVPGLVLCILALTNPGDKIIIQTPVYFPFFTSIEGNGRELLINPLKEINGDYKMDFEDLKSKIDSKTKMILLSSPHNPVGRVWKKDELGELLEICITNEIIIISDEIHSDLVFAPNKHIPIASLSDKAKLQTITLMSPTKTFNMAGLSTSYLIIENELFIEKIKAILNSYHLFHGNLFGNVATEAAYKNGEEWLERLLEYTEENIDYVNHFFATHIPMLHFHKPEGTYLLWIDFRNLGMNDKELKEFLVHRAGIGLNQGTVFGENGSGFMRMNVACPRSILEIAMMQLKTAIASLEL